MELGEAVLTERGDRRHRREAARGRGAVLERLHRRRARRSPPAPVREVQDVVANQAGVVHDPTGLYIRGGRADETGFIVDGVSAKDPLAGTGFGLDLGANAFAEVEVTTGGVGADVGDADLRRRLGHARATAATTSTARSPTSATTSASTRTGAAPERGHLRGHPRGARSCPASCASSPPARPASPTTSRASSRRRRRSESSLFDSDVLHAARRQPLERAGKLTYLPKPGMKLQGSYQRSLTVNQNTRMLQVTGNDAVDPARLPVRLRAPAGQRQYVRARQQHRVPQVDARAQQPVVLRGPGQPPLHPPPRRRQRPRLAARQRRLRARPGEHRRLSRRALRGRRTAIPSTRTCCSCCPAPASSTTAASPRAGTTTSPRRSSLKGDYTRFTANRGYELSRGFECKLNDYQWIDVIRPWVGAPIVTADGDTTQSNRLGEASDIWRVKPRRAALFVPEPVPLQRPDRQRRRSAPSSGRRASTWTTSWPTASSRSPMPIREALPRRVVRPPRAPLEGPAAAEAARQLPRPREPGAVLQLRALDAAAAPDVRLHQPRPVLPGPLVLLATSATRT